MNSVWPYAINPNGVLLDLSNQRAPNAQSSIVRCISEYSMQRSKLAHLNGYAGKASLIDLARRSIKIKRVVRDLVLNYIGGKPFGRARNYGEGLN